MGAGGMDSLQTPGFSGGYGHGFGSGGGSGDNNGQSGGSGASGIVIVYY